MKLILCITALISSLFMGGDKYEYVGPNKDYSMMIYKNTKVNTVTKDEGGYQDFIFGYEGSDTVTPAYLISVVKVPGVGFEEKELYDTSFANGFLSNCSCTIANTAPMEYKNVHGLRIEMKIDKGAGVWVGYSINILKGNNLYSVDLLCADKDFDKYKPDFSDVMNSLKLN